MHVAGNPAGRIRKLDEAPGQTCLLLWMNSPIAKQQSALALLKDHHHVLLGCPPRDWLDTPLTEVKRQYPPVFLTSSKVLKGLKSKE